LGGDRLTCGIHAGAAFCKRARQAIPKRLTGDFEEFRARAFSI
jgi:hypothetical protein